MEVLKQIKEYCTSNNVTFLVIGGHAVNAHGFPRQTGDIDLLVSSKDRELWINLMGTLKYTQVQEHPVFARFQYSDIAGWPIDLMFVDPPILNELVVDSIEEDFGDCTAKIPSLEHMIALKLHALKQRQDHRENKDLLDIMELLPKSNIDNEKLRQLCEKYDRIDLYERLKTSSRSE